MQNKRHKFIKQALQNKSRSQRWRNIILCLSFVVVFCTVFALIHPAITLENALSCNIEEHTHNENCYASDGSLICTREEHVHTEDCNAANDSLEELSNTNDSAGISLPDNAYSLPQENISSVKLTYRENGIDKDISAGTINNPDTKYLKITVAFKNVSATDLNTQHNRTFTYDLPSFFNVTDLTSRHILNDNNQRIGTIQIINQKAVITYDERYLSNFTDDVYLSGEFYVEGEINLSSLNKSNGTIVFNKPDGNVELNYGVDYMEHYGNVTISKQCTKSDKNSDYLKYTVTVTAGSDGCNNVYVNDHFTSNTELVSYVEIPDVETTLNTIENGYQPFTSPDTSPGKIQLVNNQIIWTIGNLGPNESRTLTYYAKLNDKLNTSNNQKIINTASAYTKANNQSYAKGSANAEFTPITRYAMTKDIVKQENNVNFIKDADGNYIVQYRLNFSLNSDSNYPLKKFTFADYLNYGDAFSTDRKMLPYVSYDRSSIAVYRTSDNASLSSNDYVVTWANDNNQYKAEWNDTEGNPTRFKVTLNQQLNPGDSYYVTYQLIVKPEVYAAMQNDNVTVWNRYLTYAENVNSPNLIDKVYQKLELNEYKWLEKTMDENAITEKQTISMNDSRYVYQNGTLIQDDSDTQFTVPAGSYKYTVQANQTLGQWDVTSSTMTDILQPEQMKYVGYVKVTAFDALTNTDIASKWVKIDGQSSFAFKPSQIGWTENNYAYRFEYYAYPSGLDTVSQIQINNTFSMDQAIRNGNIFPFQNLNASHQVTLHGFYNLSVQKQAWYYEMPLENTSSWKNGKHYWFIEIKGSAIREGTKIMDKISADSGLTDSWLHSDSLVGIYQGYLDQQIIDGKNVAELKKVGLVDQTNLFASQFENSKNYKDADCYSELTLTAKDKIALGENNNLYVVICTEPTSIPTQYRSTSTYKNEVYMKDVNEASFKKQSDASQQLYGGGDILKELGQTFEYDGATIVSTSAGADQGNTSKIITSLLRDNGVFASWAFKVNYAGDLHGDYRVLEEIPYGMELAYIRIKWHGDKTEQIQSKEIADLDGWTSYTNTATNDNNESQTTTYYVKGNQALIQLGTFMDGHERDDYSVDVQVVCRVNDPDILLGGKSKTFENKVTLQTSDGSENLVSATSNATVSKNSLDKGHVTDHQKIKYTITVNPLSQNLPSNIQDVNCLTVVDEIGSNLELDADSICATDKDGNSVDITRSFDAKTNTLEITVPNGKKVLIYYTATVKSGPSTPVTLTNTVYWKSYSHSSGKNDVIQNYTYTLNAGGTTTSTEKPTLTIKKWDQDTMHPLANVEFEVHECVLENDEIKARNSSISKSGKTIVDGTLSFPGMEFNTIYEVKETNAPEGYIKDINSYYIMYVNEKANNYSVEYVNACKQNGNIKIVYDIPSFKLQIYNAQKGIIVQKAFVNDAAGTSHLPMSGTYWFALYDNPEGTEQPLEKVSITYQPNDTDVKSAKFKNNDLLNTYYVFELDQNGNPIVTSDQEVSINHLLYCVEYKNGESYTNAAKVGETVTVTNYSRYKKLPSTGGNGTGRYMIAGIICMILTILLMILLASKQTKD